MTEPPVPGCGAGEEPGQDTGLSGVSGTRERDPRLAAFAQDGTGDTCPPSARLTVILDEVCGPERRCPGATDDELIGLMNRWAAVESWAVAAKLGVVRELLRRRSGPSGPPLGGSDGPEYEVSPALGISLRAADKLLILACVLETRLPGVGQALADGRLDAGKAKLIADETAVLDDARAAEAEKIILADAAGKTWFQLQKLAAAVVARVDPEGTEKRREQAQREEARLRFWRETSGTCAMAAFGLPPDEALAANATIETRAREYRAAGLKAGIDLLRVMAFADIINNIPAADRVARARAADTQADETHPGARAATARPDRSGDGSTHETGAAPASQQPAAAGPASPALPARVNLTIPLVTLLGLAGRPGEAHGLGALDPVLARDLAAAAAASPHSEFCVTVTSPEGYATGHGCARPPRPSHRPDGKQGPGRERRAPSRKGSGRRGRPRAGGRDGPGGEHSTAFTRQQPPGPGTEYGTWMLTLPGTGQHLTVRLGPIPVTGCDHRHQSHAYQPGDTLRHLVQVRDGQCTFPTCSRHARESDFEHAIPYNQGGRTCACNADARSRRCHQVKQAPGWNLTQPLPGWHQWTTPSRRTYTQAPYQYPT